MTSSNPEKTSFNFSGKYLFLIGGIHSLHDFSWSNYCERKKSVENVRSNTSLFCATPRKRPEGKLNRLRKRTKRQCALILQQLLLNLSSFNWFRCFKNASVCAKSKFAKTGSLRMFQVARASPSNGSRPTSFERDLWTGEWLPLPAGSRQASHPREKLQPVRSKDTSE